CATRFGPADSSAGSVVSAYLQGMPGTILLQRCKGLPMELASITLEDCARPVVARQRRSRTRARIAKNYPAGAPATLPARRPNALGESVLLVD
ncbi:MAG: hypothetical protein Q8N51_18840, partial [Gammaproteobacteria bacterium]|nr:hypothetical protein [Gammaproteobacteria bacterium]